MISAVPAPAATAPEDTSARDDYRAAFLADCQLAAPTADSATGEQAAPSDPESAAKAKSDSDAGLRAEFGNDFGRYQSFQTAQASGRVKILRK